MFQSFIYNHSGAISKIKNLDKEVALKINNFKLDINISGLKECKS